MWCLVEEPENFGQSLLRKFRERDVLYKSHLVIREKKRSGRFGQEIRQVSNLGPFNWVTQDRCTSREAKLLVLPARGLPCQPIRMPRSRSARKKRAPYWQGLGRGVSNDQ
jgi:hypothetical protein